MALAICGVWYGGMYNHTKDVPFASAMMGAAFFLLRALRDAPAPRWRNVLGFGILLGCALGLRASGLLMPCYAVAAILVQTRKDAGWQKYLLTVSRSLARFVPAFALAYVIMIAAWPWAALDLFNPARAIFAFAHFHYPIRTVMAGQVYLMSEVPRWYEPGYLAIKLPIAVLAGAAAAIAFGAWTAVRSTAKPSDPKVLQEIGALLFITIFPLACQVIGRGPSFTGMRHFLFVVPPIATLAGVGIDVCLRRLDRRGRMQYASGFAAIAFAFVWDAVTLVRLHPYEYLYYNSFVGGLQGASRQYATDYWVNIMPAAVQDLERYLNSLDGETDRIQPHRYTVAVCGERVSFENEADLRLQWTADWSHADFFIAPTHMNCDQVLRGSVVNVIERVGVPIGVVKDLRGETAEARWAPVEVAHGPGDKPDHKPSPRG